MPAKPREIVSAHGGVTIANHCAVVNLLRIVNLLRRSICSTAGCFGWASRKMFEDLLLITFAQVTPTLRQNGVTPVTTTPDNPYRHTPLIKGVEVHPLN